MPPIIPPKMKARLQSSSPANGRDLSRRVYDPSTTLLPASPVGTSGYLGSAQNPT